MKKTTFFLLSCFFMTTSYNQNVWIKKDSVNGPPRGAAAGFSLNGEAFVVGGINVEEFKRKMYSYDLEQDDWDDEVPLGGISGDGLERASSVGFSAEGYGFIALGSGSATNMKDLWRYDPETESWTQMSDFEGTGRQGAIAFSIDHIGYVGTGQDAAGLTNDFYAYHPITNTWEELENFEGTARKEAVGFTMGGKGYLGTGRGDTGYLTDFWEYDPIEDQWSQRAEFPGTPRFGAVGCGVFPSAFIMLGEDNSFEYKADVWEYNYFGDVWTQRADYLGGTRTQANAFVVDNRIFVGLGYNGIYHDDFYEYEKVLSINDTEQHILIQTYPNPISSHFFIKNNTNQFTQTNISVFSVNGTDYSDHFTISDQNQKNVRVDIERSLPRGNYIVVIFKENNYIGSQKIVIQ